jgi:hypothetical protein
MKMILAFLIIPLFCQKEDDKSDSNSILMREFTYDDMGVMQNIPNGALTGEALNKAIQEEEEKNAGINRKKEAVVVMIPDTLRNKKLGKNRISSDSMMLVFPKDSVYANYTEKSVGSKPEIEEIRNAIDVNLIRNAEDNFIDNPFIQIMSNEESLEEKGLLDLPKNYEKKMLQLAVEREQHILNKMVKNELDEVQVKKYNRGVINQMLKDNTNKLFSN